MEYLNSNRYVLSFFLGLLCAISPVYWFFSGFVTEMEIIKICLMLIISVFFVLIILENGMALPPIDVVYTLCVFFIIVSFSIGYHQKTDWPYVINMFAAVIFLLMGYNFKLYHMIEDKFFGFGLLFITPLFVLIMYDVLWGLGSFNNPFYDIPNQALRHSGFGGGRTGWGAGIAMVFPVFFATCWRLFGAFATLAFYVPLIFSAVILPSARGGLITMLVSLFLLLNIYIKKPYLKSIVFSFFAIPISLTMYFFSDYLRFSDVDDLSNGRMDGFIYAWDAITNNPLWGNGINEFDLMRHGFTYKDVHNSFLKLWLDCGIIALIVLLAFFSLLAAKFSRVNNNYDTLNFRFLFMSGIIISMFEPNMFFGAMFNLFPFWLSIGIVLADFVHMPESQLQSQKLQQFSV